MCKFIFRQAEISDIDELTAIESICFQTDNISKKQFRYNIVKGRNHFNVVCRARDGKLVGYELCFTPTHRHTARLYSIAILPEFRGLKLAYNLLTLLFAELMKRNYIYCNLEVRANDRKTQKFYLAFGFKEIKHIKEYYQDGEDAIKMRADITQ